MLNTSYPESQSRIMEYFILIYIVLRPVLSIFYYADIAFGLNILDLVGFFFPLVLLSYRLRSDFRSGLNIFENLYLLVVIWVFATTILKIFGSGSSWIQPLSGLLRVLNGYAVFIVFPSIFNDENKINKLMNAFFISTLFPLLQGLAQLFIGINFGGMRTSGSGNIEMYYGFYHKYDGYAWAALMGGLVMIYKMGNKTENNKKQEYLYGLFIFLYLILASLTLSRTLLFSMAVIIFTIILTTRGRHAASLIIITILMLLFYLASGSHFIQDRYKQITARSESEFQIIAGEADVEGALHGRVSLWKTQLEKFNQCTFIEKLTGTDISIGPHCDYVEWMLRYGYIGIALYLILFPSLWFYSIRMLPVISNSNLRAYGFMVTAGLFIWLIEAIIHNSSQYPDYSYFIIGNTAIFLSMCNKAIDENSYSQSSISPTSF